MQLRSGMNRFPDVVENILLLCSELHWLPVYVFKSKKFRKENE